MQATANFCRQRPVAGVALGVIGILVGIAVFAEHLAPQDPLTNNYRNLREAPRRDFWLGTDELGRDVLSRVIHGSRVSLMVAVGAVVCGTTLGGLWGLVTGYLGGKADLLSQRILEIIMSFPSLLLAMVLVLALGPGLWTVLIAIAITRIPYGVRVVRSVTLSTKEFPYVDAARAVGASDLRIIAKHVLPNTIAPWIILATAHLGVAITIEASLGFLGIGVPPPTPTWGSMLGATQAQQLQPLWWTVVFPGVAIIVTVLSFNLFGDAIRDFFDPRLRGLT
jgi:ABC-type dipeptide/oligopeptide/nickel transport system permease subunit